MDIQTILNTLSGNSKDLKLLQKNVGYVRDFVSLIEKLDAHSQIKTRVHEESQNFYSLYKAVSEGISAQLLEKELISFFGAPVKRSGDKPSMKLKFYPSIKLMGKILPEQTFFIRKLKNAEFFAAIWPWARKPGFATIHMGYYSKSLKNEDFLKLEDVIKQSTHERISKEMESGIGGQIRGINLPTFLQMSEQENSSCILSISAKDKTGRLYLEEGELIDGETAGLTGKEAVFEIIKWDNVVIEIEKYSLKRKNVVNTPLLNILLEGLKQKDEEDLENRNKQTSDSASPGESPEPAAPESGDSAHPDPDQDAAVADDLVLYDDLNKKPVLKYVLIVLAVFALAGGGVWGSKYWIKSRQVKEQYDAVIEAVANSIEFKEKEKLLKDFISENSHAYYAASAKKKLSEIQELRDDAFYEDTIAKVKKLPLTKDYDLKAKAIYTEYLNKFPSGKNVSAVKRLMTDMPDKVEESHYKQLTKTNWKSKEEKIKAYKKYLIDHPDGKHKEEVELFLVLEIEERYEAIQKQLKICEEQKKWSSCITLCDQFLEHFDNTYRTEEIRNTKASLEAKQHLEQLWRLADKLEPDHRAIQKLYQKYLAQNPDFSEKEVLQKEIRRRQALVDEAQSWKAIVAYTDNPNHSFIEKIQELDDYIDKNPSGPYADQARSLREKIRQARLEHDRKQRLAAEKQQREAALRAEILQKQRETQRLNQEILKLQKKLYPHQNIFAYNNDGTFKDKRTGLTWCILDSKIELGKCLDYEEALQYVNSLNTGGCTSWRLPSFSELASLYKNEPFFPTDSPRWFWTIERVVKGYHEMVGIVTSEPEKVFEREYVSTKKCGAVHAVHR